MESGPSVAGLRPRDMIVVEPRMLVGIGNVWTRRHPLQYVPDIHVGRGPTNAPKLRFNPDAARWESTARASEWTSTQTKWKALSDAGHVIESKPWRFRLHGD